LLTCKGVTKQFKGLTALKDVDIEVMDGEILGLIGPNGAGKTTLINCICGIYTPDGGRIIFQSKDITGLPPYEVCRLGIVRTAQIVQSFPGLSVLENVVIGSLFGDSTTRSKHEAYEKAYKALKFMRFPSKKIDMLVRNLNIVELKIVQLARAYAANPKLLLLDEVFTGLNPTESAQVMQIVEEMHKRGITILIVEHVMRVIMNLSDRIVVLHHGEKIAEGTPREVANNELVIKSYLGERYLLR